MGKRQADVNRIARLSADELSILCEQVALILRSGLPLHDGVEALCDNYRGTRYAQRFDRMHGTVLATGSLYRGLVDAGIFPTYLREMANIGERTGELDNVMGGLALYYQREAKIRRAVVNAIAYPLILIAMMGTLVAVLIGGVLPIFDGVFRSMGVDTATNPWLNAGVGTGKVVLVAAAAVIAAVLLTLLLIRLDRSGKVRQAVLSCVPALRRTRDKVSASRFAAVMAMMLKSGFPLDESLKLVSGVIADEDVAARVRTCREKMAQGIRFADAVEQLNIFQPLHERMIRVGEVTGQVDGVMKKLAEIYEDEADDAITHAVSIIEPTLVALMSVVIGAILLAVMLPLLSLMGGMA
jgi:type IV pilus assembly protein PilC